MEGFKDDEGYDLQRPESGSRKNKHDLELTRSGRPSIKKNEVNGKFTTKYRSQSNTEKILSKLLPIGKACVTVLIASGTAIIVLGLKIPLEEAGHADRLRIFKSAAFYCLDVADLSEILDSDQPALRLYLKGSFRCRFQGAEA